MNSAGNVRNYLQNQLGLEEKAASAIVSLSPSTIVMVVATLGKTGTVMDNNKGKFSDLIEKIAYAYEAIYQCKSTGGKVVVDGVQYDPEQFALIQGVVKYLLPPRLCVFDDDSFTNIINKVDVQPVSPDGLSHLYDLVISYTRKRDLKANMESVPVGYANTYRSMMNQDVTLFDGENFYGHNSDADIAMAYDVSEHPGLCVGVPVDTSNGFINALAKVFMG